MANRLGTNPIFIDTNSATALISHKVRVESVVCRNKTAGTLTMRLQDAGGDEFINVEVPAASQEEVFIGHWVSGILTPAATPAASTDFTVHIL